MMSEVNDRRLRTIQAMLTAGPEHFNIKEWYKTADIESGGLHQLSELVITKSFDAEACGTTACLAGWAIIANPYIGEEVIEYEQEAIDVVCEALDVNYRLFYREYWGLMEDLHIIEDDDYRTVMNYLLEQIWLDS
jgi:hypothetical protein